VVLGVVIAASGLAIWSTKAKWAVASLAGAFLLSGALLVFGGPCEYETTYHCAIVQTDLVRQTGRTLILDQVRNSYVDLEDPTYLEFRYIRLMVDIIESEAPPGELDVVSIGGGGFTLPGYIEHTRPASRNIALEIDPKLLEIGREELALTEDVEVVVDDARISLRDVPSDHADVVIGDAYSGASVPWHLTTVEFTEGIDRVLAPGGTYTMNVIDYGELDFIKAEAATLREVFSYVALFAPPNYLAGASGGNFVLVASQQAIDVAVIEARIAGRGGVEIGIEAAELTEFIGDSPILTDDYAPVDQMLGRL
jgi:spermidine synthase